MIIDSYFKEMMDGIDMVDIRNILNMNSNYRALFKETLQQGVLTVDKNTVGVTMVPDV